MSVALNNRLDNQLDQERNLHAQGNVCRVNQANVAMERVGAKIIGAHGGRPGVPADCLWYQRYPHTLPDQFGDGIQFVQFAHVSGIEMKLSAEVDGPISYPLS